MITEHGNLNVKNLFKKPATPVTTETPIRVPILNVSTCKLQLLKEMGWVSEMVTQLFMATDVIAFDLWAQTFLSVAFRRLDNKVFTFYYFIKFKKRLKLKQMPTDIGIL